MKCMPSLLSANKKGRRVSARPLHVAWTLPSLRSLPLHCLPQPLLVVSSASAAAFPLLRCLDALLPAHPGRRNPSLRSLCCAAPRPAPFLSSYAAHSGSVLAIASPLLRCHICRTSFAASMSAMSPLACATMSAMCCHVCCAMCCHALPCLPCHVLPCAAMSAVPCLPCHVLPCLPCAAMSAMCCHALPCLPCHVLPCAAMPAVPCLPCIFCCRKPTPTRPPHAEARQRRWCTPGAKSRSSCA